MPLEDGNISKEPDGFFNESYCRWCYANGNFCYTSLEELTDFLVEHMSRENWSAERARAYLDGYLPTLQYWKQHGEGGEDEEFKRFKEQLIREFNELHVKGMPEVKTINFMAGGYINMEYPLANGRKVKLLEDDTVYPANQLVSESDGGRCFGIAGNKDILLVCTYEENGEDPELVVYRKR